jgi:hypothetical protein
VVRDIYGASNSNVWAMVLPLTFNCRCESILVLIFGECAMKTRKIIILCAVFGLALLPVDAISKTKKTQKVTAPTGAAREKQFKEALKSCQKKYGGAGDAWAEWGSFYGRTGWWCVHRG